MEDSQASKRRRGAAGGAEETSAMEVGPSNTGTPHGAGGEAAEVEEDAAGAQLGESGIASGGAGGPLAAVAPALFELLTRLLLTDRSIRDTWS